MLDTKNHEKWPLSGGITTFIQGSLLFWGNGSIRAEQKPHPKDNSDSVNILSIPWGVETRRKDRRVSPFYVWLFSRARSLCRTLVRRRLVDRAFCIELQPFPFRAEQKPHSTGNSNLADILRALYIIHSPALWQVFICRFFLLDFLPKIW